MLVPVPQDRLSSGEQDHVTGVEPILPSLHLLELTVLSFRAHFLTSQPGLTVWFPMAFAVT